MGRARLGLFLIIPLAFSALGFLFWDDRPAGPFVIYLVDTLRPDRMSLYGGPRDTTPAATALARDAVTYRNAFATSTWTRPSVATLLTSRLPSETGALDRYGRLDNAVPYLPQLLQRRGWRTAAFVGNGNVFDDRLGFQRGFDLFRMVPGDNDSFKPYAYDVVDPALEFIRVQRSPRFFLYIHVVDPHSPYILDANHVTLFEQPPSPASLREKLLLDYDRLVRQADDQFARLAAALRNRGWWDSATILYLSDHGEELLEHGGQGHGRTLYDEEVRIPLIVKFPKQRFRGERRDDPVSLADATPTIAELAGLSSSDRWIGNSLTARFARDREIYLTEELDDVRLYGLRKAAHKLVVQLYPRFDRATFDLRTDPVEKNGRQLPCGAKNEPDERSLFAELQRWRSRDVAAYPSLTLEKVGDKALLLDVRANLRENADPFLTDADLCRFSPAVFDGALLLEREVAADEPFRLQLSANERGDPPPLRVSVLSAEDRRPIDLGNPGAPVRLIPVPARFIKGPTTDELLRHLRSLGYLAGGSASH